MSVTVDGTGARAPLAALRRRLSSDGRMWKSLEELADGPEFRHFLDAEFPALAAMLPERLDRRTLLKLMGATLAMGGLAACEEAERILPYVRQPENMVPGVPRFYATTLASDGYGIGALVETHEGRPTKIEGNPDHPSSLGATDAVMQAAAHELFDPERSRTPLHNGATASYDDALADLASMRAGLAEDRGASAALLVEPSTSPTLKAQLAALKRAYPRLRVFVHATLAVGPGEDPTELLFGRALVPLCRLDRAATILSLDADWLGEGPGRLAYARAFAQGRRVRAPDDAMNRLYAVESTPTITGAAADHHKALRPSEVALVASALAAKLRGEEVAADLPVERHWLDAVAADLRAAGRAALVLAGNHQGAAVHAAAWAMNMTLGAHGHTIDLIEAPHATDSDGDLADLCGAIAAGEISTVFALAGDPARTAPADLDVDAAFAGLEHLVHWGLYASRTAQAADWHLPAAHELESWSDMRAHDGTASIVQPLIQPLYGGWTQHRLLAVLMGAFGASDLEIVRATWEANLDEAAWKESLKAGVVAGTAAAPVEGIRAPDMSRFRPDAREAGIEIRFVPDPYLRDGRHANSAWLQELPHPITKQVWGNSILVSPATAEREGIGDEQVVDLSRDGHLLQAPVSIVPGHPDGTVTLVLGYGPGAYGTVAAMASGYDAFRMRTRRAPWMAAGAELRPTERHERIITTQHHHSMEGRHIVRHATLETFRANPDFVYRHAARPPHESVYEEWHYPHEAWGMSIDQTVCTGCMACVAACQAENNIPTVGPQACDAGLEMHWLRVDRYYHGDLDAPETYFQPVPCMHCEKAPCEVVCPVNATVHTHDGLNAQVYNRCIGTRYCSQNCPYKVRRFNFLEFVPFDKGEAGPEQAVRNPDVSVRSRGVMEKCTYCVQRISAARIEARIEGRDIEDGEVVTACQAACPTRAISFGDLNNGSAEIVAAKAAPHDYGLLEELNTRPRTTYLGHIRNANPALTQKEHGDG